MIGGIRICQLLFLLTGVISGGCTPTMAQMRHRFQQDVEHSIGFTLAELRNGSFPFVGSRIPTESKDLPNGHMLQTYGRFWEQGGLYRTPCDVFLEIDPKTDVVVAALAEGEGCFMPY